MTTELRQLSSTAVGLCPLPTRKPTFEPTKPSQSVARSRTSSQTTDWAFSWTSQNAPARDNVTRPATVLSYLAVRRIEGSSPFASTRKSWSQQCGGVAKAEDSV